MTISTTNVPQYAQGLSVHNPQARTSSITPRTRGNHPKRTLLRVPVGVLPITLEMPPIISMTAEMNSRMAMIVIPRGRLRIVPVTSCRMRSSNREAARSTVDIQKTMRAPISFLHFTSLSQGTQISSSERETFSNRLLQDGLSYSIMLTDEMRKRNLETHDFCFCFLHDPLNVVKSCARESKASLTSTHYFCYKPHSQTLFMRVYCSMSVVYNVAGELSIKEGGYAFLLYSGRAICSEADANGYCRSIKTVGTRD